MFWHQEAFVEEGIGENVHLTGHRHWMSCWEDWEVLRRWSEFCRRQWHRSVCSLLYKLVYMHFIWLLEWVPSDFYWLCSEFKFEFLFWFQLVKLCQQAGYKCLLEDLNGVLKTSHFLAVLKTRLPITTHHSLKEYEEYEKAHDWYNVNGFSFYGCSNIMFAFLGLRLGCRFMRVWAFTKLSKRKILLKLKYKKMIGCYFN